MSDSLWPHGLQPAKLPCPSPTLRACSNSCPLTQWCHPTISFSVVPFSSCLQSFPESGSFPGVSCSHKVAKVLKFQLQHQYFQWRCSTISFRMDWLDLLAVQGTLESSPILQFKSINSSALRFLYSPTFTPIYDYWKKTTALTRCSFVSKVMSAF